MEEYSQRLESRQGNNLPRTHHSPYDHSTEVSISAKWR
jgi:hypothetical protein